MYLAQDKQTTPEQLLRLRGLAQQLVMQDTASAMTEFTNTSWIFQRGFLTDWLPKHWWYCTVVSLQPSQQIVAHADQPLMAIRYHLPLQVNDGCWVFHDGVWQQLDAGRLYTMDPAKLHGAVNWGSEVRLHLIVDC